VIVVVAGEMEKSPVPTAVTSVLFALFTVTEKVAGLLLRGTDMGDAGKLIVQAIGVAEGDGDADGEGEAEGDGDADGEGEAEGDGDADGEGEAEGDDSGDGDGDGEADGEGEADGDGLADG
jgi:hypothetical protein